MEIAFVYDISFIADCLPVFFCKKKMDSATRFFCFPVRFVHCKYNTLIFEKKYCKGTSFVLKRYYFGTIYRILYSSIVTLTALVRLSSNLSFYQLLCKFLSLSSFVLQSFLNLIHSFEDICYCFCLIHRPLCRYILISCRYILCKEFYKCPSYKWLYKEYL